MPDETKASCPKCGAEADNTSDSWPQFKCLSMCGPNGEMMVQSDACTIAALTAQLARANKQIDDILADGARECPKCDASIDSLVAREEGCVNCDRLEAQQQLADARLLAKAANNQKVKWCPLMELIAAGDYRDDVEFSDGLPILTPELRTALRKAIGEV